MKIRWFGIFVSVDKLTIATQSGFIHIYPAKKVRRLSSGFGDSVHFIYIYALHTNYNKPLVNI